MNLRNKARWISPLAILYRCGGSAVERSFRGESAAVVDLVWVGCFYGFPMERCFLFVFLP